MGSSMVCTFTVTLLAQNVDSKQLAQAVGGAWRDNSDNGPLERAIQSMRDVHKRIVDHDVGDETQKIQRKILTDLETLIKFVRQHQTVSNSSQQQMPQSFSTTKRDPISQRSKKQTSGDTETNAGKTKTTKDFFKQTSEGRSETGEVNRACKQALIEEIWGHLPRRMRQKILNILNEQPLREYEELVHRYYQALAESGRKSR